MFKKVTAILLLALFTSACAKQQALFISEPAGATVFVDGRQIGVTPCTLDYSLSAGQRLDVTLEKAGYEEIHYQLKTDEVDSRERKKWLAAGVVWSPLWLGTLFTKKFKDSYEIVMKEDGATLTAGSETADLSHF
ncbi:PEGA domain-containing protein [Geoalkalibacter sp.]|uniref:PEGA domain-containing protein n=1 Tax=Geoalkalibacter sp. TaxID=3041440 RepID=UPI00272ECE26|nr:PEGA domain-containing protein [Geoalkalibacter sp.]